MNVNGGNNNRRGGRSRNRRRRRGNVGASIMPGGIRVNDTEVFSISKPTDVVSLVFCPGKTTLPRLDREAAKYGRWSLIRVIISYQPTASLADKGAITYGILPGPASSTVSKEADIVKLRPFQKHALWKSSSITVSSNIMIQKHMYTGNTTEDSVGFTVYFSTADEKVGVVRVSYELALNYPKP